MDKNLLKVDDPVYQTLSEFLFHPFGVSINSESEKYNSKYEEFKSMISVVGYSVLDESYYIHVKVPSESQPGKKYDVVIQFIPQTKTMVKEHTLDSYVIQFFSNSPGFIYKYAALYKLHGYMIDALQEKLDPEYADKLPEQANSDMKLMYDKSIYFATKFLYENRLTYLSKSGIRFSNKLSFRQLVDSIISNKESLKETAYDIERKAVEEGKVDRRKIEKSVGKRVGKTSHNSSITHKSGKTSTSKNPLSPIKPKITGKARKSKTKPKTSTRK